MHVSVALVLNVHSVVPHIRVPGTLPSSPLPHAVSLWLLSSGGASFHVASSSPRRPLWSPCRSGLVSPRLPNPAVVTCILPLPGDTRQSSGSSACQQCFPPQLSLPPQNASFAWLPEFYSSYRLWLLGLICTPPFSVTAAPGSVLTLTSSPFMLLPLASHRRLGFPSSLSDSVDYENKVQSFLPCDPLILYHRGPSFCLFHYGCAFQMSSFLLHPSPGD